jgi:hypothetical protein
MVTLETLRDPLRRTDGYVDDGLAGLADEMAVRGVVAVVPQDTGRTAKCLHHTFGDEKVEVPVHGAEREARETFSKFLVEFRRGRVNRARSKLLEDLLALPRMVPTPA